MILNAKPRLLWPPPRKMRRGFTLVELLAVVGIVAMLVAMLLPALNKARQQALKVACASNMKQIWLAINSYASEFKGATVPSCYDDTDTYDPKDPSMNWPKYTYPTATYQPVCGGASGYVNWLTLLWKYHKGPKIYICPNAAWPVSGWTYQLNTNFCPAYVYSGVNAGSGNSYELNNPPGATLGGTSYPLLPQGFAWSWPYLQSLRINFRLGSFRYKEDKILLTDSRQGLGYNTPGVFVFQRDRLWWGLYCLGGKTTQGPWVIDWATFGGGGIDANHRGYANCLMLDGSVQAFNGAKPRPLNDNGDGALSFDSYASYWRPDIPNYRP